MTLGELRRLLAAQGVTLTVTSEGKLRYVAPRGVPQDVVDEIRSYKAELLQVARKEADELGALPRLPAAVASMVRAASAGHLQRSADLASGFVPDVGEFVVAWAIVYLVGEHDHALRRLNEALVWMSAMRRLTEANLA